MGRSPYIDNHDDVVVVLLVVVFYSRIVVFKAVAFKVWKMLGPE